jgi:hypothetical protein
MIVSIAYPVLGAAYRQVYYYIFAFPFLCTYMEEGKAPTGRRERVARDVLRLVLR